MKKICLFLILPIIFINSFCKNTRKNEILVLHAGSLSIPFKEIAKNFMKKYPDVKVVLEAHGSRTCARQITDLERRIDVMASADTQVIKNLLMPEYADFSIDFTTNEMTIMYNEKSKYSGEINSKNWYKILLRPDIQYGHSDPNADPCGYRTILTWKLAEKYYKVPGLFKKLDENMPKKNIRPKEVDLIAMLEAYELDYIFIYKSVAFQHKAKYVILPDEINLKSPNLSDLYRSVSLKISGKKPGEFIEKKGAPMVYGITLLKNSLNPDWGKKFVEFLLDKEGQKIMRENGQPEMVNLEVDNYDKLPEILKKYFKKR
jgi:molybdate/tungstate transport system substrate-binding protein